MSDQNYPPQPDQPNPGQPAGDGSQPPPPYGAPPPPPPAYGAPPPAYGAPQGYGAPPPAYGAPQMANPYASEPGGGYAQWGDRVVAYLWDFILYLWPAWVATLLGGMLFVIGGAANGGSGSGVLLFLGGVLLFVGFVLSIWRVITNYFIDQGRTGYTYGKRKVGIRLVRLDGQAPGAGSCVGRYFLHSLINQLCYIDFLWPLWDQQRQTLTDKVLNTVVIKQPDTTR